MATEKADDQPKPAAPMEPQFPQPSGVGSGGHGIASGHDPGGTSPGRRTRTGGGSPGGGVKRGGA